MFIYIIHIIYHVWATIQKRERERERERDRTSTQLTYHVWTTIEKRVYHTDIQGVDELKQRLIQI